MDYLTSLVFLGAERFCSAFENTYYGAPRLSSTLMEIVTNMVPLRKSVFFKGTKSRGAGRLKAGWETCDWIILRFGRKKLHLFFLRSVMYFSFFSKKTSRVGKNQVFPWKAGLLITHKHQTNMSVITNVSHNVAMLACSFLWSPRKQKYNRWVCGLNVEESFVFGGFFKYVNIKGLAATHNHDIPSLKLT